MQLRHSQNWWAIRPICARLHRAPPYFPPTFWTIRKCRRLTKKRPSKAFEDFKVQLNENSMFNRWKWFIIFIKLSKVSTRPFYIFFSHLYKYINCFNTDLILPVAEIPKSGASVNNFFVLLETLQPLRRCITC